MNRKLSGVLATLAIMMGAVFYFSPFTAYDLNKEQPQLFKAEDVSQKQAQTLFSEHKKRLRGQLNQDSPGEFYKYHNQIRTPFGADRPDYPMNYRINELLKGNGLKSTAALGKMSGNKQLNWVERGPGNVGGRTRSILVHPDNIDVWYAGSVGGGVWKTEDAGQSWTNLTSDFPNLATSALAWSPNFPNTIYAGTGEGFGNSDQIDGSGVWKSIDAGVTWTQLANTANRFDFENVTRLVVDPTNPDNVNASVVRGGKGNSGNSAIYRSTDGGVNWSSVYQHSNRIQQIVFHPSDFLVQYAAINGVGVIKSTDGGQTWVDSGTGFTGVSRIELAIAPSNSSVIYAATEGGINPSTLFSSADAGATWLPHADVTNTDIDWLIGQGWYDNAIAVNPYDETEVFVGGIDLLKLNVVPGEDVVGPTVTQIMNSTNFMSFINFGGDFFGGGIDKGNAAPSDYTSIEIRFGSGLSQMAHRFYVPQGSTSGVPASQYTYQDYVEVPFQVWDTDNNRQLMASFRDQTRNGKWELAEDNSEDRSSAREYLYINAILYDASTPNNSIAKTGGHEFKHLYFMWPVLSDGENFDPAKLPQSSLRIDWGIITTRKLETTIIADGRRRNGGTPRGVHVDHHYLTLVPTDAATQSFRLLNGNDGGVAYSDNKGTSFKQTGDTFSNGLIGYNTSQFYGVDKAPGTDRYVGGSQDNGSWVSPENADNRSSWSPAPSGDGFEGAWNYWDSNKLLESSQFNNLFRSDDGGVNWRNVSPPESGSSPFISRIGKSKQDADLIFAQGSSGIWRSDDFADNWQLVEIEEGFSGGTSASVVRISLADPQIVWNSYAMVSGFTPLVSKDGGFIFSPTTLYSDVEMSLSSDFTTHPTDPNTAYFLSSLHGRPKILRTTDLGQSWQDISGFGANATSATGFPDVSVYSLLVMPYNTDIIWAGTEVGLVESTDGGATWAFANNGLPNTALWEMLIVNDEVVVATHGRGIWSVEMPELSGYEPLTATIAPRAKVVGGAAGILSISARLISDYDSTQVIIDGAPALTLGATPAKTDTVFSFSVLVNEDKVVPVKIFSYKNSRVYRGTETDVFVYTMGELVSGYKEGFEGGAQDFGFVGGGWVAGRRVGFANKALHSPHPYLDKSEYQALLKLNVEVASGNAILKYDDIALVEPGDVDGFYDFCIVEASKDSGVTWQGLTLPYDARFDPDWLEAFNAGTDAESSLFRTHEINLLDFYQPGDRIMLRWRLWSDELVNGYGWVIDNISYRDDLVSVGEDDLTPLTFGLSQNYPNPFNPTTRINYSLASSEEVSLEVFNINGQRVRSLLKSKKMVPGRHFVEWDGKNNSGASVASGTYFYRIEAGDFVKTAKMLLLK